jgi:hypothetical protein
MTTVGYGDISPSTGYGRLYALVGAVAGLCCAALLVTALINAMTLSSNQETACNLVTSRVMYERQRKAAHRLVSLFVYWSFLKRKIARAAKNKQPVADLVARFDDIAAKLEVAQRRFTSDRIARVREGFLDKDAPVESSSIALDKRLMRLEALLEIVIETRISGGGGDGGGASCDAAAAAAALTLPQIVQARTASASAFLDQQRQDDGGAVSRVAMAALAAPTSALVAPVTQRPASERLLDRRRR